MRDDGKCIHKAWPRAFQRFSMILSSGQVRRALHTHNPTTLKVIVNEYGCMGTDVYFYALSSVKTKTEPTTAGRSR